MYQRQHRTGLRTIFFPTINKNEEKITLSFIFATPIKFGEKQTDTIRDIYHTFSASHLIEHTLIEQNIKSFDDLDEKYNATIENAYTSYNLTYYVLHINDKRYIKEAVNTTLKNLMEQNSIDKDSLLHELEIIKHEFNDDYFNVDDETIIKNKYDLLEKPKEDKKKLKNKEKKEEIEKQLIKNIVLKLEDDKKATSFYKKHYVPQNTIITVDGGNRKTYDEVVLAIDDFFKMYPEKLPNVYNFIDEDFSNESYNPLEKSNEFYDKLFSNKYYIFPLKDKTATYSQTRVYFKVPKNRKFVLATKLLMAVAYKQIATSTILVKNIRQKEKLVYGIEPVVDILENSNKYALSLSFKTESKNIKTALTSVRKTLNEIADCDGLKPHDFNRVKKSFAKEYYESIKYFSLNDDFEDIMLLLYSDKKLISLEKDMRILKDLKYEDIVNVAKFLSKSNQFTVQCFGNNLQLSDLQVFSENINGIYDKKDLNHFFGGNEKIEDYQNENFYDAKKQKDKDAPIDLIY